MNNVQRFLESIEVKNTFKVMNFVLGNVDDNIEGYSLMELEQFILDLKPNNPKAIVTICYVLSAYAKWLKEQGVVSDDSFYHMIQSFDKKLLWKKAKPLAKRKFISYEQFKEVIDDIEKHEEYNALYFRLLFECVYEGIYNDDMSVVKNLKSSDIEDNMVTLHEDDGHTYKLKISKDLASNLKKLEKIDYWERPNRYNICKVSMRGAHYDSVFKIESRDTSSDGTYRHSYYARLRKISKEYIGYSITPLQLYVSGIMHRVNIELNKNNITLKEAFTDDNRDRLSHSIISKELMRCNYGGEVSHFRDLIKGHLESF